MKPRILTGSDGSIHQTDDDRATGLLKKTSYWLWVLNVMVCVFFVTSIGFAYVQIVAFMYPCGDWWDILNYSPKAQCESYVLFTYEVVWRSGLYGLAVFLVANPLSLIAASNHKLGWRVYLSWTCIQVTLLFLSAVGFFCWLGVL